MCKVQFSVIFYVVSLHSRKWTTRPSLFPYQHLHIPFICLSAHKGDEGNLKGNRLIFKQDSTNYVEHLHEKTQSVTASNKSVIVVKVVKLISGTDRLFHFHFDNFDQSLCWRHLPLHKPTWGEQQKQISWKYAHFARQITKDAIIIYLFATISMLFETNHSF